LKKSYLPSALKREGKIFRNQTVRWPEPRKNDRSIALKSEKRRGRKKERGTRKGVHKLQTALSKKKKTSPERLARIPQNSSEKIVETMPHIGVERSRKYEKVAKRKNQKKKNEKRNTHVQEKRGIGAKASQDGTHSATTERSGY